MATQTQAVAAPQASASGGEFQAGQVLTIVAGHSIHDMFSGFVAPLLPLIIERLSLTLTQAGALASLLALPAVLNPFIGYVADRLSLRYFVIFAPAVTATLMSSLGIAPGYPLLALMLVVTGVSVAAFHAPALPMVGRVSGGQVGKGMGWFMAGGELGRTVGPLLAVWAVSTWTMDGYYRIVVLGWAASAILFWRLHGISAQPTTKPQGIRAMLPAARRLFPPLLVIAVLRNVIVSSLSVYLPIYLTSAGASLQVAGVSLSIWELAGVGGALVSGPLSDRLGRKPVILGGLVGSSVMMFVFLGTSGIWLVPVLLGLGLTSLSISPVMLAMVQEHMPTHRAVANGIFISALFLLRSLTTFLVGVAGDAVGLETAFGWAAIGPLLAIPAVFWLPRLKSPVSQT